MEWLRPSYKQSQSGEQADAIFAVGNTRVKNFVPHPLGRKCTFRSLVILAVALLGLPDSYALEPGMGKEAVKFAPASKGFGAWHALSEEDLRAVSGQGLAEDRLFQRLSMYATSGFSVEVLGDMATVLNPVRSLLDAETTFKDAIFNPINPTVIIDKNGSFMVRIPDTIGTISFDNIRVRGSNGTSFGSVTINNIDVRGTTIRVTARR
ncbi:MAG TPA: hypothetical protein VJ654_04975 [Noviherbaspirillum sp.]|nr:hypothetical protein [Noviherbaspirillum sp.]